MRSKWCLTRCGVLGLLVAAFGCVLLAAVWRVEVLVALASVPLAVPPARTVIAGASGPQLVAVLGATGRLQLGFGAAATLGLALGGAL